MLKTLIAKIKERSYGYSNINLEFNMNSQYIDINLIKALSNATAYQHEVDEISVIETHISWVLLTGQYAYKIKKPVKFSFLDFSTLEQRRFFCHEELRLNKRLAADLYLAVVPITGSLDDVKMDGLGEILDYAVKMHQFPAGLTLSERVASKQLNPVEIDQLSEIIATFHQSVATANQASPYGCKDDINYWFNENFAPINALLIDPKLQQQLQAIERWGHQEWQNKAEFMTHRKQQGFIRECHGDLHLSNMTLINGNVTLFDCLEFNPLLRWIDVISEVAFVLIDLLHVHEESLAFRLLNRYLQLTGDYQGVLLLRYYLVYRALVSAKVALLRQTQQNNGRNKLTACLKYQAFINLAEHFSQPKPVKLIISHGYSGSGKSTLMAELAETLGAIHIRGDIERKRIFGYSATQHSASALNNGLYTSEASQKTYDYLAYCAKNILSAGFSVIVDATFLELKFRQFFKKLATECNSRFIIIDVQASYETLCERIKLRQADTSEATIEVLDYQRQWAQALTTDEQLDVITVNTEADKILETLLSNDHFHRLTKR
jgi:aminoglycoside phosphotransferase family enzyme/predicted kinase